MNTIAKQTLMGRSNIELTRILDELSDDTAPSKITQPLSKIMVHGRVYNFSIVAEEIVEKYKIGNRVVHKKYGPGTVSCIPNSSEKTCYTFSENIYVVFDNEMLRSSKRMYVDQGQLCDLQ